MVGLAAATQKGVAAVAAKSVLSDTIPSGGADIVGLPLDATDRPAPGEYKGSLVAAGALGGDDSAPLTLTVAAAPPKPSTPATPARLLPDTLTDFSVSGVNFIPSVFDPLPAAVFGAGVLLAILLLPFVGMNFAWLGKFRRSGLRPKRVTGEHVAAGYVVAAALILVGAVTAFGKGNDGFFEGPGPHLVEGWHRLRWIRRLRAAWWAHL